METQEGQAGISIIELLVAMTVLGIVLAGTAAGVTLALGITDDSRAVTVASGLATASIEDALAAPFTEVELETSAPLGGRTTVIDGRDFTVTRSVAWVQSLTSSGACVGIAAASDLDALLVDVTVDWQGRRASQPVSQVMTLSPPVGLYDPNAGNMVIEVTDAEEPSQPVGGVLVTIRGPVGGVVRTYAETTDAEGCAAFEDIPPGDYDVSVAKADHIDPEQRRAPDVTKTVGVGRGTRATAAFRYAPAERLTLDVVGREGGQLPADGLTVFLATTARTHEVGRLTGPTTVGLWPESYQHWAGGCRPADPEGLDAGGALIWPTGDRGPATRTPPPPGSTPTDVVAGTVAVTWGFGWVPSEVVELVAVSRDDCPDPAEERVVLGTVRAGIPVSFVLPWGSWDIVALDGGGTPVGAAAAAAVLDPSVPGAAVVDLQRGAPSCATPDPFVRPGADAVARAADADGRAVLQIPAGTQEGDLIVVTTLGLGADRWVQGAGWTVDRAAVDPDSDLVLAVWTRRATATSAGEAVRLELVRRDLPHLAQVVAVSTASDVRDVVVAAAGAPGDSLLLGGSPAIGPGTLALVVTGAVEGDGSLATVTSVPLVDRTAVTTGLDGTHLLTTGSTVVGPPGAPARQLTWDAPSAARFAVGLTFDPGCR